MARHMGTLGPLEKGVAMFGPLVIARPMFARVKPMPTVTSIEDAEGLRCIDIIERDDHTFVIRECRRDPEARRWSVVGDYSGLVFPTKGRRR